MTRQEAIALVREVSNYMATRPEIDEAIDMAIEALEQEPCDDCISRKEIIRWVKTECNPYGKPTLDFESGKKVIEHLEQMPSAKPKTGKESRTMTREEAIELLRELWNFLATPPEIDEAVNMAIEALEQEPCDDCISRKETIRWVKTELLEIATYKEIEEKPKAERENRLERIERKIDLLLNELGINQNKEEESK